MIDLLYRLGKPVLFSLDPERAHELTLTWSGRLVDWFPGLVRLVTPRPPTSPASSDLFGTPLRSPLGLAAGLDKNAVALPLWERLGFGFVEIGTVTPRPQVGNPRPRVHRLKRERALINAMGFPNDGSEVIGARLERYRSRGRWPTVPVGINLGKNKDTPADQAHEDYRILTQRLRGYADYLVINVSSPNTPGLRDLQATDALRKIAETVLAEADGTPVFVKLAPDLADDDLRASVEASAEVGASGLIATNTTITRPVPGEDHPKGGLSGRPLFDLAQSKIKVVLDAASNRLPVIGVGGVDSAARAQAYLDLGCAAVQLYTGLIYGGPGLPRRIVRGLRR